MSVHYGPYREVIDRVKHFQDTASQIVIEEALMEEDELIRINTDDQLFEGINADGVAIADYQPYTPYTKTLKEAKGQPTGRVTLFDTGDFYKGFKFDKVGTKIYPDSTDSKTERLVKKYGEQIFGLTDENLQYFINIFLKPRMIERFKKMILP